MSIHGDHHQTPVGLMRGQNVEFDDGAGTGLHGTVTREAWGRSGKNVTVKDTAGRTFVRLDGDITPHYCPLSGSCCEHCQTHLGCRCDDAHAGGSPF